MLEALSDDLNTPDALMALDELARRSRAVGETNPPDMANDLAASMVWLGLATDQEFAEARADNQDLRDTIKAAVVGVDKEFILQRIEARAAARKAKDFKEADRIRDELLSMGVELTDGKDGTTWKVQQ
jgi:cysteinyl-tRNA synthetase